MNTRHCHECENFKIGLNSSRVYLKICTHSQPHKSVNSFDSCKHFKLSNFSRITTAPNSEQSDVTQSPDCLRHVG